MRSPSTCARSTRRSRSSSGRSSGVASVRTGIRRRTLRSSGARFIGSMATNSAPGRAQPHSAVSVAGSSSSRWWSTLSTQMASNCRASSRAVATGAQTKRVRSRTPSI